MTADDLLQLDRKALLALMCGGHAIDAAALDDSEYRGVSLGLPRFVEKLTWKKFKKTFRRDRESGALIGWNVRCEQNGLDAPWLDRLDRAGAPVTFGPYQVVAAEGVAMPAPADRGLLIDYRQNAGPLGRVRDPIVALRPGDPTLLLGWSYLELGFSRISTPVFFSLERHGPLSQSAVSP